MNLKLVEKNEPPEAGIEASLRILARIIARGALAQRGSSCVDSLGDAEGDSGPTEQRSSSQNSAASDSPD